MNFKDTIVKFETAKLANQKGYINNRRLLYRDGNYYNYKGELNGDTLDEIKDILKYKRDPEHIRYDKYNTISAPTQSLLNKWLRSFHNIEIVTYPIESFKNGIEVEDLNPEYSYYITIKGIKQFTTKDKVFESYDDALEDGLLNGLNYILN